MRRQQKILSAIKGKVISFETFIRLPWVSWAAPKAIRSDMSGPTLLGLVGAELIGGDAKKQVLTPRAARRCPTAAPASPSTRPSKQRAVDEFLEGLGQPPGGMSRPGRRPRERRLRSSVTVVVVVVVELGADLAARTRARVDVHVRHARRGSRR